MVDVDTAQEYRCKTTYACALRLIELGILNYEDRTNTANIIKNKLNKEQEYLGFLYYTEQLPLEDYYKLL